MQLCQRQVSRILLSLLKFGRGHTYLWLKHKLHSKISHADASSTLLPCLCFAFQAVCSEMELTELWDTEGYSGMATVQQTIRQHLWCFKLKENQQKPSRYFLLEKGVVTIFIFSLYINKFNNKKIVLKIKLAKMQHNFKSLSEKN